MSLQNPIPLTKLPTGKKGKVVEILGGQRMTTRLDALGVRPGVIITKQTQLPPGGPVTIMVGRTQLAIGRNMASGIMVVAVDQ